MNPIDLRPVGAQEYLITWEDGSRVLLNIRKLRMHCPCATCVDEMTGKRMIQENQISETLSLRDFQWVGNYALRFLFSDGHHTGIYSFDYLRKISLK